MSNPSNKPARRNIQQEVTDRILAELEKGALPWVKPWKSYGSGNTPHNALTKRPYSGGNVIMLWLAAHERGYQHQMWLTFKQARELGGTVRRGEEGVPVYYMSTFTKTEETDSGEESERRIPFLKAYTVFNIAQCDNLPEALVDERKPINVDERNVLAEEFCTLTGARFLEGDGEAYYVPSLDVISMPAFERFKDADNYYATKFHELGHWTGAKKRLNRDERTGNGAVDYAFEELVAELTSAFCCAEFGFNGDIRHAGYIEHWIKLLKEDNRAFIRAASAASKAHNYLRGCALSENNSSDDVANAA